MKKKDNVFSKVCQPPHFESVPVVFLNRSSSSTKGKYERSTVRFSGCPWKGKLKLLLTIEGADTKKGLKCTSLTSGDDENLFHPAQRAGTALKRE